MKILIKNGRVLDPASKTDKVCDVYINEGLIEEVGEKLTNQADYTIDAKNKYVMPGLIDMHVHLRDPGLTYKEDIASGAAAAAKGGYTTIVAMPNTKPVMDSPDRIDYVHNKAKSVAKIHVLQAGAITKEMKGKELSDIEGMAKRGIPAISEDGKSVMNSLLALEAMKEAKRCGISIFAHCEDITLVQGGCVNKDANSEKNNLPGISNAVEDIIAARDIILAEQTGVHLHLCHCSTESSYYMLKAAKEKGLNVTGEVCPHHFTLTSDDVDPSDANYKMNPPVRTKKDRDALIKGLKEGIFDVISTDHAPHAVSEKNVPIQKAAFGIVGSETAVALTITELVKKNILTPLQMAERMSYTPAKLLKLDKRGSIAPGMEADLVIIDPDAKYTIDKNTFVSKGKNTPFHGRKVQGKVDYTICSGRIVYMA